MDIFSFKYSIPYFVFFIYLLGLMSSEFVRLNQKKDTKLIRQLTMFGFLFFFGLRGHLYTDWVSYYEYFKNTSPLWDWDKFFKPGHFEYGFQIYTSLIKTIWNNYHFWVFVNTLIDIIILNYIFKKYSKYYVLSFIFFFLFEGLGLEVNLYRAAKAVMLFLLSIKYIEERKLLPFLLLNILGSFFHITAVVFIPMYFILHKKYSIKILLSLFVIGNILFLFQIQYIEPLFLFIGKLFGGRVGLKIDMYLANELYNKAYGLSIGYLERSFSFLFILYFYKKLANDNKSNIIFLNAFMLYILFFLYFTEISVFAARLANLFVFSYWIIYPNIYKLLSKKVYKYRFLALLLCYASLRVYALNNNILARYDNLLFGIQDTSDRKEVFENYGDKIVNR